MARRHSSEEVESLFGHLNELERAMAHNQKALLESIDDFDSVSQLAELREQADLLETEIINVVNAIQAEVKATTAAAVFGPSLPPEEPGS
jgi:hypothetical protein